MPANFSRTTRALLQDRATPALLLLFITSLLVLLWIAWLFVARVTIYAVTPVARLEASLEARRIEAKMEADVRSFDLYVGRQVLKGETLVTLNCFDLEYAVHESEAGLKSLEEQAKALSEELKTREELIHYDDVEAMAALAKAEADLEAVKASAKQASEDDARFEALLKGGHVSVSDREHAKEEATARSAAVRAAEEEVARRRAAREVTTKGEQATIASLHQDEAITRGKIEQTRANLYRLGESLELCTLSAPLDGVIAEVVSFTPGERVRVGQRLATLIPDDDLRIVAYFPPAEALGRIHEGQAALFRLEGFPWIRFGALEAVVLSVSAELRDGKVRVELLPLPKDGSPLPLRHGLPGQLEIALEEVSPWELILRASGKVLYPPVAPPLEEQASQP